MTGAECLLRTLVANDIDLCLMNPGTSEMQFVAALDGVPEIRGVLCLFEGVCSGAADGYARMTGRPASTLLHLGPGLANALANFHNARKARSPVVSIVGEHATQHMQYDAPLTADISAFAGTVSGWVRTAASADGVGELAAAAVAAARKPPGQVATLIVPADLSWSPGGKPGPRLSPAEPRPLNYDHVREAAKLIRSGKRIAILLSGKALLARGLKAAGRIAGVPIFANRFAPRIHAGAGVFAPQRLPYFPEAAEPLLAGLEHLILIEAQPPVSFFAYPGRRSYLAPENCRMHVLAAEDQDGAESLEALAEELGCARNPAMRAPAIPMPPTGDRLSPEAIGDAVAALMPEGAIISDEMVSVGERVWARLNGARVHDVLPVTGGAIGQGLPVALGAALACPERKVIALEADGSGMYTLQALWTMARERCDITVVIFSNRRYAILNIERERTGAPGFGPRGGSMIDLNCPAPDWVKIAEGLGVSAQRIDTVDGFVLNFREAMIRPGPHLIEAML